MLAGASRGAVYFEHVSQIAGRYTHLNGCTMLAGQADGFGQDKHAQAQPLSGKYSQQTTEQKSKQHPLLIASRRHSFGGINFDLLGLSARHLTADKTSQNKL